MSITVKVLPDSFLPPVRADLLVEVALRIHVPDRNQRNTEVAAFLEVVAGKETQASCIDGEGVVQAIFRGEIGDGELAGVSLGEPVVPLSCNAGSGP